MSKELYTEEEVLKLLIECKDRFGGSGLEDYVYDSEVSEWFLRRSKNKSESDCTPKDRGCCPECGEGYDNEEGWLYNTECEICGHPIPDDLIIKKP